MTTSGLKETSKKAPAPRAELENGHGNGQFSRRHSVREMREKRVLIRFDYDGEPYEAIYNKAAVTIEFGRRVAALAESPQEDQIRGTLTALLLDWDLVQDDGTPLPCSVEEIERQPNTYLVALINAIWTEYNSAGQAPGEAPSETP